MAVPLIQSSVRSEVVDFTAPFLVSGNGEYIVYPFLVSRFNVW